MGVVKLEVVVLVVVLLLVVVAGGGADGGVEHLKQRNAATCRTKLPQEVRRIYLLRQSPLSFASPSCGEVGTAGRSSTFGPSRHASRAASPHHRQTNVLLQVDDDSLQQEAPGEEIP